MPRSTRSASRRYAEAAFQLADRDRALEAWEAGLAAAAAAVSDESVAAFIDNPAVPLKDRLGLLDNALGTRTPDGVLRLVKLLAQRRATDRLPGIAAEFRRLLNKRRGIVEATVTSAAGLTADEVDAVRAKVANMTDREVDLQVAVDARLIGGLTVRIGDTLYDASVRGRLERMRESLLAAAR